MRVGSPSPRRLLSLPQSTLNLVTHPSRGPGQSLPSKCPPERVQADRTSLTILCPTCRVLRPGAVSVPSGPEGATRQVKTIGEPIPSAW